MAQQPDQLPKAEVSNADTSTPKPKAPKASKAPIGAKLNSEPNDLSKSSPAPQPATTTKPPKAKKKAKNEDDDLDLLADLEFDLAADQLVGDENPSQTTISISDPAFDNHKAGFVSIVGKPNAGKSTLMNQLIGEKLSIITSRAQTTRHRIFGLLNGEDFQIVYSDTPGVIQPKYELHRSMMRFVNASLEDADLVLFVTDLFEDFDETDVIEKLKRVEVPVFLLINKIDLAKTPDQVEERIAIWKERLQTELVVPISALLGQGTASLFDEIIKRLPNHPPYFPKEDLTDRSERFFASEIIREKLLTNYRKEVPYSCEVIVQDFKERGDDMLYIRADILVERSSQRAIIIGHQGEALKKVGVQARADMETFFGKKVYLETHVKVEPDWRNKANKLKYFGYSS